MARVRAQILAQALAIVRDQHVGAVEDVAMRAIILLQLDQVLHLELVLEGAHVANVRAAKRVDALVIVADGKQGAAIAAAVAGQQFQPVVLQIIRILELVHQNVAEARLVVFAQGLVAAQQFVRAQQQFCKIDDAFALALVVIQLVQLDHLALVRVVRFHVRGAQALVLGIVDEIHHRLRREFFIIDIVCLQQALDHRQLILRIEDLEGLRQGGVAVVRAQQAVAQAVEGTDPHAARVDWQHGRQAREHFLGGLVGKGHGQDAGRRYLLGLDQPRDAGGQHAGLARTGASEDQRMLGRQGDGGILFGIEVVKKILHAVIIPAWLKILCICPAVAPVFHVRATIGITAQLMETCP